MSKHVNWSGVFPAVTTQFNADFSVNLEETHTVISNLVRDGVSGLVVCGSVGENTSLTIEEKMAVTEVAKDASGGRVPVICGIAEFTSAGAAKVAKAVERVGVDGIMVMPALVYSSKPHETAEHFRSVASGTDLPVMVYNNPPIYRNDVTPDILVSLADCENIVCFKDSSGDTRRFIDVRNQVGERFILFAGLDDVVLESVAVGAQGWISGMSNVFPKEGETIFRLARAGRFAEAMPIYEWLMPILHLDARPDLVQCIKLLGSFGLHVSSWFALLAGVTFNNAGYLAETFRGGLQAVPETQLRAARSLGMSAPQAYRLVVIPQLLRVVFYPLTNQLVWAMLMTSLGVVVGLTDDLTGVTQALNVKTFRTFEYFALAAVLYFAMAKLLVLAARLLGWRLFRY